MKDLSTMTPVPLEDGDAHLVLRKKRVIPVVSASLGKATSLGTVNVSQTAVTAIGAGARNVTISVPGLLAADTLMLFPLAVPPTGYSLGNAVVTGPGQATVAVTGPLLALGASYSIPCRAVVFR